MKADTKDKTMKRQNHKRKEKDGTAPVGAAPGVPGLPPPTTCAASGRGVAPPPSPSSPVTKNHSPCRIWNHAVSPHPWSLRILGRHPSPVSHQPLAIAAPPGIVLSRSSPPLCFRHPPCATRSLSTYSALCMLNSAFRKSGGYSTKQHMLSTVGPRPSTLPRPVSRSHYFVIPWFCLPIPERFESLGGPLRPSRLGGAKSSRFLFLDSSKYFSALKSSCPASTWTKFALRAKRFV